MLSYEQVLVKVEGYAPSTPPSEGGTLLIKLHLDILFGG